MKTPTLIIEEEVRELVRRRQVDPAKDEPAVVESLIDEVLSDYELRYEAANLPRIGNRGAVRKTILDRVAGFGALQPFLDDPTVEEVWINGPGRVFVAKNGRHTLTSLHLSEQEVRDLVERMLRASGRRLDLSSPFVDATLLDGSRLHVAIPDITPRHWAVNIRKFVLRAHRLDELIALGSLNERAARFLQAAVEAGLNVVVSGGTQAGKTTMLNCLASCIPPRERIVTCEEVFELQIPLPDVVSMQTRQRNLEGRGEIDLRRLIVEALRMRPDRIIVGEVRQKEAFDLLIALNSGLPGMTSIHANSAGEALNKLMTLPLLAGENVSHAFVVPTVAAAVDLVVHLEKRAGTRRTVEIVGVTGRTEGDLVERSSLFAEVSGRLEWTGHLPPKADRPTASGAPLGEILR